jgi:hypothetical protein
MTTTRLIHPERIPLEQARQRYPALEQANWLLGVWLVPSGYWKEQRL